ncbi:MAG: MarR family transcriptional regulator [Gammaproteobacteria bacterium]|nr:MarR family transcriptional regulator [Gammaproteobacteria bacterium]
MPRATRARPASERSVAELALQLGRAAYGESGGDTLTPAQWMALRFFARANRFSRTVSGFADYHATTRGTASQTVNSLVAKGYLTRTRSLRDGRSATLDLTEKSRRQLSEDPFEAVVRAARTLKPAELNRTAGALRGILQNLAVEREKSAPAACGLCGHLERDRNQGFHCRLLHEPLSAREIDQLCVHCTCNGRG